MSAISERRLAAWNRLAGALLGGKFLSRKRTAARRRSRPLRAEGKIKLANRIGKIKRASIVKLSACAILFIVLFSALNSLLPAHWLQVDEPYVIGRAMQNLEFLEGIRPASEVWVSYPNNPYSGDLFIALSMIAQGQVFQASSNPWTTNATAEQVIAARRGALLVGVLAIVSVVYLALDFSPLIAVPVMLYLLSSPGLVDISLSAMSDVYVASFTCLGLVSLSYYMLKDKRWGLRAAAILLGVALGSTTAWDSIVGIAIMVLSLILLERRHSIKRILNRFAESLILIFASFALTSPVTLLRLPEHVGAAMVEVPFGLSLTNLFTDQPLVSTNDSTVFIFQLPSNLALFAVIMAGVVIFALTNSLKRQVVDSSALRFLVIMGLFASLTFLLGASTFDWGRVYARHALYEALIVTAFLIFIVKSHLKFGFASVSAALGATLYSFASFIRILPVYYQTTGLAVVPSPWVPQQWNVPVIGGPIWVAAQWFYAPAIGWITLLSLALAIPALSYYYIRYTILSESSPRMRRSTRAGLKRDYR